MKNSTLFIAGLLALIAGLLLMRHDHDVATQKVAASSRLVRREPGAAATMTALDYVSDHMEPSASFS